MSEIVIDGSSFVLSVKNLEQTVQFYSDFDVFCYTNAVDLIAQEIMNKNITIVREPNYSNHWSEFTFRDLNGYQISVGGGIINTELIS